MNRKTRIEKLEQAALPKPLGFRVARQVEGVDQYTLPGDDSADPVTLNRAELFARRSFPLVILPAKAESAEEWAQRQQQGRNPHNNAGRPA